MSKSNTLENYVLRWLYEADDQLSAVSNLYVSLHTADPGEAGDQTTNEAAYTGYARVAVARSGTGWTVTNDTAVNDAAITFGQCTAGSATATHFGLGTAASGAGVLLASASLTASLAISAGITPEFAAGQLSHVES